MIRRLKQWRIFKRLLCRHPNITEYRMGFLSEHEPWERAVALWCPDCGCIVWRKERIR